jgi:hypothetical protein
MLVTGDDAGVEVVQGLTPDDSLRIIPPDPPGSLSVPLLELSRCHPTRQVIIYNGK